MNSNQTEAEKTQNNETDWPAKVNNERAVDPSTLTLRNN